MPVYLVVYSVDQCRYIYTFFGKWKGEEWNNKFTRRTIVFRDYNSLKTFMKSVQKENKIAKAGNMVNNGYKYRIHSVEKYSLDNKLTQDDIDKLLDK